jgi:sarcosine oxidase subunit beta
MPAQQLPSSASIIVVGGGVMGASSAYHLALAGAKQVLLLESEPFFGQGATGRCAGGVRYQFGTEVNVRLSIESLGMLERFREETGQDPQYRKCGYLFALTQPADVQAFQHNREMQRSLGVQVEWLEGEEIRRRLPYMRLPDALAGTYHALDGLADPHSVVMGYVQRARQLGATVLSEARVSGVEVDGGRVRAIVANGQRIACEHVINAAGPWAGQLGEMAGVGIPITPVRRQMVTTTPLPELPADFPFVIDFAQSLYFHREGEGLLTGMSNPNEQPGLNQNIDEEWELTAMDSAVERMPMLAKAGRLGHWAGLYEVTPDAHPIFGGSPVGGFWIVAGFSGHGFMHGPIAGKLMAEFLLEGRARTVDVSSLDLARFQEGRLIQEYNVV